MSVDFETPSIHSLEVLSQNLWVSKPKKSWLKSQWQLRSINLGVCRLGQFL